MAKNVVGCAEVTTYQDKICFVKLHDYRDGSAREFVNKNNLTGSFEQLSSSVKEFKTTQFPISLQTILDENINPNIQDFPGQYIQDFPGQFKFDDASEAIFEYVNIYCDIIGD